MANRQGGVLGIDLHGCCVEVDFRLAVSQQKAHDAVCASEFEPDPRRVFARVQWIGLALNLDVVIVNAERHVSSLRPGERTLGSAEARVSSLRAQQIGRTHGG